ncbi:hypothetical protein OKW28_004208 [Paraburkholderia sp. 40]
MNTRSPVSMASQLGAHAWFRKRGAVAAAAAVDHSSAGQPKHERVARVGSLTGGGAPPTGHFPLVLDHPFARGDRLQGEQSHAMHW